MHARNKRLVMGAVALAATVGACARPRPPVASAPAAAPVAPPPKVVQPEPAPPPPPPPPPAVTPYTCGPRDPEWEEWFDDLFGRFTRKIPLSLDPKALQQLPEAATAVAETMLRRGLEACDPMAVVAIERADWRQLMPDLTRTAGADNADFGIQAMVALRKFGDRTDFSDLVAAALTAETQDVRASAAEGARFFTLERLRQPLLDRMRDDPAWEVRFHAAESLLDLADVYPRDLADHPDIERDLHDAERAGCARAATALDELITKRLAAGACPKAQPLERKRIRAVSLNERLAAVTVEDRIGACERHLAFVVFVPSRGGFGAPLFKSSGAGDRRPAALQSQPFPLTVDYRAAEGTLLIGSVVLDLKEANVAAVAAVAPQKAVEQYHASQDLGFERRGRPDSAIPSMLRFDEELAAAVRTVLNRSPELAAQVNK